MTPLPLDRRYPEGPVTDQELAALGIESDGADVARAITSEEPALVTASISPKPAASAPRATKAKPRQALRANAKTIKTSVAARAAAKKKVAARTAAKKKAKVQLLKGVKPAPKSAKAERGNRVARWVSRSPSAAIR